MADLARRVRPVLAHEVQVVRAQLKRNGVEVLNGLARFADPHSRDVEGPKGTLRVRGERILIACGTRPAQNAGIPFDGRKTILDFIDQELIEALTYHLRRHGITFRPGETVVSVKAETRVVAELESGKTVQADALLCAVGRQGNTDCLDLAVAGLTCDSRGPIAVNAFQQTEVPHIYAAGDIIGFPSLASTSMEQGRLASCHMFGTPAKMHSELLPYGIYTIPEISTVGRNEQELTAARVPYEVGIARYEELAKAQMIGDQIGLLKLLFDPKSLRLLGVHALGDQAAEIIHIGQAVLALGGTIAYFRDTVFNYPTLAEAYKVAALDGLNK